MRLETHVVATELRNRSLVLAKDYRVMLPIPDRNSELGGTSGKTPETSAVTWMSFLRVVLPPWHVNVLPQIRIYHKAPQPFTTLAVCVA